MHLARKKIRVPRRKTDMKQKKPHPSQLMELYLTVCEQLGFTSDRAIASLADAGIESVANWRSGAVREFKVQKFKAIVDNLAAHLVELRQHAGIVDQVEAGGLTAIEIEDGSSPADLQRQFRDRVGYDYLGHRFLYFEPQGALAWERLIKVGYEQDCWLEGVAECVSLWLSQTRTGTGQAKGAISRALGLGKQGRGRGLDIISLGPGEGGKEMLILDALLRASEASRSRLRWLSFTPVDVSIALLLTAARSARELFAGYAADAAFQRSVIPTCADFEEGPLNFTGRLRTSRDPDGLRLVLFLGNVLGNVRDEETFVRKKLRRVLRPGDLVWIEVGLREDDPTRDPLYTLTDAAREETSTEANRRLLLEGPYRRWAVASGRSAPDLDLRVWVRSDDDSSRVPGSYNFCHDLVIRAERRTVTMLYSRRYDLEGLCSWFESLDFAIEGIQRTRDSQGRSRVGHLLLRRL